jgi:hypothetical protein
MRILRFLNRITGLISLCLCLICASPWPHLNYHLVTLSLYIRSSCFSYTVKNPSWKFRNIFMKARALSSIFLNFSILSYWFLIIHLCIGFGSKLQHTFFTVYWENSCVFFSNQIDLLIFDLWWKAPINFVVYQTTCTERCDFPLYRTDYGTALIF